MTKEQINKVFNFLDKEMNNLNLFYFKLNEFGNISACFKSDDERFCTFYPDKILEYLENSEESDK